MKPYLLKPRMIPKPLSTIALMLLLGATHIQATQVVRELWDQNGGKVPVTGKGDNNSSFGFDASKTWAVSPPGNTGLQVDGTWSLWGYGVDDNTALSPAGAINNGTLAFYGGNMNTLTNPATSMPYGYFSPLCYATRALATNSYINFKADATYYFSVRIFRGWAAWGWSADTAGGIGFASSGATNASFVGAGITRNSPFYLADGSTDIGGGCYITTGTLNQAGTGNNIDPITGFDTDGGPYYPRAGAAKSFTDGSSLLVGRLTTTASGNATMDVKLYPNNTGPYPSDPSSITWDTTYNFTETNIMTHLLVWEYGGSTSTQTGNQDGLRVGTTWADVMGLELVGAIKANPTNTVYAGSTVTLSQIAGLNNSTYPMTFQWYSNSVAIVDATNSSLVLTNPTVDFTADYTIAVSNYFGMLTNTPIHVTVNAAVKPFFTQHPLPLYTNYVGGIASLVVGVDGTPSFTVQLTHAGTNVPGVTAALSGPGTVTLKAGPISITDAASSYAVVVTNAFGSATSQVANVTLVIPPTGSFEQAALTNGAAAIWKLSETTNEMSPNGVVLKEYVQNLTGLVPNEVSLYHSMSNVVFGAAGPGPVLPGFSGITSLLTPNTGGLNAQVNLPTVLYSNQMTMVVWMKAAGGVGSDPIFYDRNKDSGSSHCGINHYNGSLGAEWGSGTQWNSGIVLPGNRWIMVALVVEPNETTLYAGTDPFTLQSVTRSSIEGTNHPNSSVTLPNGRLVIGRGDYSWAQDNNAWGYVRGNYCDAAIFYKSLTPAAITNLFVAGFGTGTKVVGTPTGTNNLSLDWYPTFSLQEADAVTGPYTDVLDINSLPVVPPYASPIDAATNKFYRAYQILP